MTQASFEEEKKLNFFLFSDLYGQKNNNNLLPEKLSTSKQLRQPLEQQQQPTPLSTQQQQPTPSLTQQQQQQQLSTPLITQQQPTSVSTQQQQQQPTPNTAEAAAATVVTIQVYFSPLQKTTLFCEAL